MCSDDDLVQSGPRILPSACKTVVAELLAGASEEYLLEVDEAMQQLECFGACSFLNSLQIRFNCSCCSI